MAFVDSRLEQIRAECDAFHRRNPMVWTLFVRFTFDRIGRGFRNYSASAIFERIRWEMGKVGDDGADTFKLNNNYRAEYARRFMREFPEHDGFFRTRERPSARARPSDRLPLGPSHFDAPRTEARRAPF